MYDLSQTRAFLRVVLDMYEALGLPHKYALAVEALYQAEFRYKAPHGRNEVNSFSVRVLYEDETHPWATGEVPEKRPSGGIDTHLGNSAGTAFFSLDLVYHLHRNFSAPEGISFAAEDVAARALEMGFQLKVSVFRDDLSQLDFLKGWWVPTSEVTFVEGIAITHRWMVFPSRWLKMGKFGSDPTTLVQQLPQGHPAFIGQDAKERYAAAAMLTAAAANYAGAMDVPLVRVYVEAFDRWIISTTIVPKEYSVTMPVRPDWPPPISPSLILDMIEDRYGIPPGEVLILEHALRKALRISKVTSLQKLVTVSHPLLMALCSDYGVENDFA
jgi:hypothetical protein